MRVWLSGDWGPPPFLVYVISGITSSSASPAVLACTSRASSALCSSARERRGSTAASFDGGGIRSGWNHGASGMRFTASKPRLFDAAMDWK